MAFYKSESEAWSEAMRFMANAEHLPKRWHRELQAIAYATAFYQGNNKVKYSLDRLPRYFAAEVRYVLDPDQRCSALMDHVTVAEVEDIIREGLRATSKREREPALRWNRQQTTTGIATITIQNHDHDDLLTVTIEQTFGLEEEQHIRAENLASRVEEMLIKTTTAQAPWTIVAGNDKRSARIQVLKTVVDRLSEELHVDASPEAMAALPPIAAPTPIPDWAKVEAACEFVEQTGAMAGIGRLDEALEILRGEAGTLITQAIKGIEWRG